MSNFFLMPVSFLYKLGVLLRHRLFDWGILKQEKFDIPVVGLNHLECLVASISISLKR